MMRRRTLLLLLAAGLTAAAADPLRVMSFNVRYPAKGDGPDLWDLRKDFLVETIRKHRPDIMGTQELFYEQGEYIVKALPEYVWFGVSRRGNKEDEHMGVFVRKDRFDIAESGNFWLSETPDTPGSMSWNVTLPRMVTWAVLKDKSSGRELHYFNTHFPHRREDAQARVECAKVLAARIAKVPRNATVVLTGDFNTGAGTEPYQVLTALLDDVRPKVANPLGPEGTFHGFRGTPGAERIDWILTRGALKPVSYEAITDNRAGRYPSDHFPVQAVLEWSK